MSASGSLSSPERAPSSSEQSPPEASWSEKAVFAFLLELGKALLATGDAVSDIEDRLIAAAKAYGQPSARVMVLPTAVSISGGPREPATLATVDNEGSLGSAGTQLRLDQITEVMHIARAAAAGEISPERGVAAVREVYEMPSRYHPFVTVFGYTVVTLGIGLIIAPVASVLPAYAVLGLLVALMREGARRVPGMNVILPVLAAGTVSAIAFAVSGRYEAAPLVELIAPLVLFLPGALLTMATIDLASAEVVTGASRFMAGMLQLALLAFGIVAGAMLVGVAAARASATPSDLLGWWAAPLGVLVFAIGTALHNSAPRRSLRWLLLVLYAAWGGQLLGQVLFGAELSGFVGGLVVAPLATLIERFPSAPPALVSFLPAFWLLVPGALGLIGFTQLVGNESIAGITSFGDALISIISIALGILIGLRALHIAQSAVASARNIARP